MSWHCPACRTEILHIVRDRVPDPSKTYRCQLCRLNLEFSRELGKMNVASFQPDDHVAGPIETHLRSAAPVIWVNSSK